MQAPVPLLTVVIPVRDEADCIPVLAAEIAAACAGLAWEAVWVDDASQDGTRERLRALPPPHRYLAFAANCGQSAALMAGARAARGAWIGTLDGDGQNDPADLPRQLAEAESRGVDMVNGIRVRRRDAWRRRLASRIGNAVRTALTGRSVSDVGCSTRVLRRELFVALPYFHGMHRHLPTLVLMRGGRIAEVPVNHRPRHAGRSKYGILDRAAVGLRDLWGVRWLQARNRVWTITERSAEEP